MSDRPVLALLAASGASAKAVPLLGLLGRHAQVVSWRRRGASAPDAVLVTSVDLLNELVGAGVASGVGGAIPPFGVWVRHHDEVDRALGLGATILLTSSPDLVARGAVLVPRVGIEVDRWPAVAPVVRARWRERLGLAEAHVVHVEPGSEPAEAERSLAIASAVVVSGPATLLSIALGAPTVTSADTARRLGARPGRDVEVAASSQEARAIAEEIARDDERAASLSRRARRCAEHHLDLGHPAEVIARRLGLVDASPPTDHLTMRLDELHTASGSPVRRRSAAAMAVLVADREGSAP